MKRISIIAILIVITLLACEKYKDFEGTYDLKSNGNIKVSVLNMDTTFVNEPGLTIIKKGGENDELFIYVETGFITSVAPLGVYATAKVDGNKYEMDAKSLTINFLGLPFNFTVDGSGTLSDKNEVLTSEIVFSGGIVGTMTSVGSKR